MPNPPKTPPEGAAEAPVEKNDELKREEAHPAEVLKDIEENQKGLPPGADTPA